MNKEHNLTQRKIVHSTMRNYIQQQNIGKSLDKRGSESQIPIEFWDLLRCHISMAQLEGKGETKLWHLKRLIGAALRNTKFENYSANNIYSRFRNKFPPTVNPTRAMEMEERRSL